jgi:hypothetical protein
MKCRGCDSEKRLIKAHIIPRSFYMDLRSNAGFLSVVPSESSKRVIKSNIGDYDPSILCHECDQVLAVFDEYGKQVLIDVNYPFEEISKAGAVAGWNIRDCNSVRLEKFFLSILWRASISNRNFFRKIKLGPYDNILREYLWSKETCHPSFGCVVAKFRASQRVPNVEKTILDPHRFKYQNINYYRLYLGGYIIWIRIDKRKPADTIGRCELTNGLEPIVVGRSFDDSKELNLIHRGVLAHEKKT